MNDYGIFIDSDYNNGLSRAEWAALFSLSVQDGRLLPFEIRCSVGAGEISKDDFFKVSKQSYFIFEVIVFRTLEEKDNFINS